MHITNFYLKINIKKTNNKIKSDHLKTRSRDIIINKLVQFKKKTRNVFIVLHDCKLLKTVIPSSTIYKKQKYMCITDVKISDINDKEIIKH